MRQQLPCSPRLSIRDIVLIDRLDIDFSRRPVGADRRNRRGQIDPARCLRAGARRARRRRPRAPGRRAGAGDGGVRCCARTTRRARVLADNDIAAEDELILRRVQLADGRTRAFVNDSAGRRADAAAASARRWSKSTASTTTARWSMPRPTAGCSMLSAGSKTQAAEVARLWDARRAAEDAVTAHRAGVERAQREADFLRHAVEELQQARAAGRRGNRARRRAAPP